MATLSELLKELKTLPLGNVYKKTIHGNVYYYHQYFKDGVRFSRLVNEEERLALQQQISRRLTIEKMIRDIHLRDVALSKNANELTGYVMCGNTVTATFEKGILISIDEDHAPLVIKRTHSLEEFLKLRVMDMSRTNARILKKVLNIHVDEEYKTSLYSYALSISDHYWFKPKHSKLKYQEVNFDNDSLFETSLKGEVNVFFNKAKLSPEITTTGSFEKGWRYIDGEWWLYKKGNDAQLFSELFCAGFAKLIGISTVEYELDGGYIRCKNFSPRTNFEPMAALAGDNDQYEYIFSLLKDLRYDLAEDYVKLIFFDSVMNNIDRHNENYGLLRDPDSGGILTLAPNFDNNLALIATNTTLNDPSKDGFIKVFVDFITKNEDPKKMLQSMSFPDINIDQIWMIALQIPIQIPNLREIVECVFLRYNYLRNML